MTQGPHRVGLIVPSSNTTIETEVPAMLGRAGIPVTLHSSRAVMHSVEPRSLERMVQQTDRCTNELADAHVDAIVYACLVALMAQGPGAHEAVERQVGEIAVERLQREVPVVSSAGALIRALQGIGAARVAIMTPYVPALTQRVAEYLAHEGIEVVDSVSLGVQDNIAVGRLNPHELPAHVESMDISRADALVASACVQMPSLAAVPTLEERFGVPVLTAATATVAELLPALGRPRHVPDAGVLLRDDTDGPPDAALVA